LENEAECGGLFFEGFSAACLALRGEEIIIARHDKPGARLGPVAAFIGIKRIGGFKGQKLKMTANLDDPAHNAEIARTFETP
jgi:antitoxin (DNA-binding transcriptional repressor) of toxin-antitoxin stability system